MVKNSRLRLYLNKLKFFSHSRFVEKHKRVEVIYFRFFFKTLFYANNMSYSYIAPYQMTADVYKYVDIPCFSSTRKMPVSLKIMQIKNAKHS